MSIFNYQEQPGYFRRLKEALKITKTDLGDKIDDILGTAESRITEQQLEDLEGLLIGADVGVQTSLEIIEKIREETRGQRVITSQQVRRMIRAEILNILQSVERPSDEERAGVRPQVTFVVGVNGVGKTTTIGKLTHLLARDGHRVLICASDTFRAAAVEQLAIWAERTGSEMIKQSSGADPAAVLYDALAAGKARSKDWIIVDTAGRLHTKSNLMQELEKMKRVASREVEGAPHEVYLVLDATTGQNGLIQAREFLNCIGVTGIIVTKLDGTAKGGIVVAIAKELQIPVRFIGTGEGLEDLLPFDPMAFVDSLFAPARAGERT